MALAAHAIPTVAGEVTILNSAVVSGVLRVDGTANFSGGMSVAGNTSIGEGLQVAGETQLLGPVRIGPGFELVPGAAGGLQLRSLASGAVVWEADAEASQVAVGSGADGLALRALNTSVAGSLAVEGPLTGVAQPRHLLFIGIHHVPHCCVSPFLSFFCIPRLRLWQRRVWGIAPCTSVHLCASLPLFLI